ncbi:hypothetical protein [Leucobacter chromiireducens]|uniref:hypothetical protein n=1 Tax=Leucobacter chromiireducens TaxID=283877 RepID=UPI000F63C449|nr:hypothetical protein [Leucobacter chromiireducens]
MQFGIAAVALRRAAALGAAVTLAAGVGLLAGCAPEPAPPAPTAEPTPAPTTSAEPDPEPTEDAWTRFSDPRMPHSFELPPGWTVSELVGDGQPGETNDLGAYQFGIFDPDGTRQLYFASRVQGLGGACAHLQQTEFEVLDNAQLEIPGYVPAQDGNVALFSPPEVVFRAGQLTEGVVASLGLADSHPPASCMYYNVLHTDSGLMAFADRLQVDTFAPEEQRLFATMDEARAYTETEEYRVLVRILSSLRIAA